MVKSRLAPMPRYSTIGRAERDNIVKSLSKPLSGYLGGITGAGYWVERLAKMWCEKFGCQFAVPCNSATSGLLAACMAAGVGIGDEVWVSAYTMSATAAAPKMLGAVVWFTDIEDLSYSMEIGAWERPERCPKALIVTNLFGHPARLSSLRRWCNLNKVVMIEDNAQSVLATEGNRYAGTIGHMGVWSLNVHKQLQAGEGGIITTDDPELHEKLQRAINHGELYPNA